MDNNKDKKTDDILEKLVHINRITKVVKGGRRFGFSALVVVGNQSGKIGIAHAKAKQVPDAIKKANEMARRKLTHIPLREGRTIHHDVKAKDGSGRIVLRAASKGTGIIAGGPVRAVCEVLGVKDIVAKSMGTSNAHNVIRATMKALMKQNSPKQISTIRNKKISEIIEKIILNEISNETIECIGPEKMTFRDIIKKLMSSININRLLIPTPLPIANIFASVFEATMRNPLLTKDQLVLLSKNNAPSGKYKTNIDLNLNENLKYFDNELIKYSYMWKSGGEFSKLKN